MLRARHTSRRRWKCIGRCAICTSRPARKVAHFREIGDCGSAPFRTASPALMQRSQLSGCLPDNNSKVQRPGHLHGVAAGMPQFASAELGRTGNPTGGDYRFRLHGARHYHNFCRLSESVLRRFYERLLPGRTSVGQRFVEVQFGSVRGEIPTNCRFGRWWIFRVSTRSKCAK